MSPSSDLGRSALRFGQIKVIPGVSQLARSRECALLDEVLQSLVAVAREVRRW